MKNNELISLIEHIQLNKSGWFKEGIKGIIKQVYGERDNNAYSFEEIENIINDYDGINFKKHIIKQAFDSLVSEKILIPKPDEEKKYKLSDESYRLFKKNYDKFTTIEKEAKVYFIKLLSDYIPYFTKKETLWEDFIKLLIQPIIAKMGAKSFEIITGSYKEINYDDNIRFFKKYQEINDKLKVIIPLFFDSPDNSVKKYLLNLLNTFYFIEATQLKESDLDKIYSLSKIQSQLKIFIDTNFLLSLLDLHDNPLNEAANSLKDLLLEVKNKIDVRFYVFPHTIEEFQNLIKAYKDKIKDKPILLSPAKVLVQRDEISGVSKKYYQKCIEVGAIIDLNEYFDPYLNNLHVILRKHDIEIQNEKLEKYDPTKNMDVNDDILAQVDYRLQKSTQNKNLKNEYELDLLKKRIERRLRHDCILWHAVNDKRPEYIDSIKDIKTWILTLDFQFLSYDRYKTRALNKKIGLCLHPNDLISLLYFWVPRTEKFEQAIIENFRLPFSFKEFDEKTEHISMAIMSALSRYENSKNLDEETITEILTNEALRNKIDPEGKVEENAKLIKDEIFEKYKQKKEELDRKKTENQELKEQVKRVINELKDSIIELIERKLSEHRTEIEKEKEFKLKIIEEKKNHLADLKDLKRKADGEVESEKRKIRNLFKSLHKIKKNIYKRYPNFDKIEKLENDIKNLEKELDKLEIEPNTPTIFFCENKNAKYYNKLGLPSIKFVAETNSAAVFLKIVSNSTYFGIRDRDFLTDEEIIKLKDKYKNYKILEYYCFENYLYHPDNLENLKLNGFNKQEYINEIKKQIKQERDQIISKLTNSRKSYQEFKPTEDGIKPDKDWLQKITDYLDSNDIEDNLKAFSLKDFDKSYLAKYNLKVNDLIQTEWFLRKIKKLLE